MILFENIIFDENECSYLRNNHTEFVQSYFKGGVNKKGYNIKKRNSFVSYAKIERGTSIIQKIKKAFNDIGYELLLEELEVEIYKYNTGNFIKKHIDVDPFDTNRFCVCIGQLTNPSNYTGGGFISHIQNEKIEMSKEIGNFLIITPNVPHEVEVIESGERISIIIAIEYKDIKSIYKKELI